MEDYSSSALEEIIALTALQCKCARIVNSHLLKVRRNVDVPMSIHTTASQKCPSHICDKNRTSKICMVYSCPGLEKCKYGNW